MFLRVVRERKRRELDPTADAIKEVLTMLPSEDESEEVVTLRSRLRALVEIFELIDVLFRQFLKTDTTVEELKGMIRLGL
jgi:DNA-binding transcriptional regulator GbsR (MarR family)